MFNSLRRFFALLVVRHDSDDRHAPYAGPLVEILEADLAHLDHLSHLFAGGKSRG